MYLMDALRRAHWYSGQDRQRESSDLHAKKEREGGSEASDIAILPNGRRNVMESNGRRKPIRVRRGRKLSIGHNSGAKSSHKTTENMLRIYYTVPISCSVGKMVEHQN